ncbi:MAG: methylmalonyl-CoA epimerase [Deferribacteraceae bacterium]|jgi:methylmalonyl-CoA/ethylmalonyl-CoA epimerase|nr:methylmalonyl-CoA epimerase [Deferribacteraceae bacterium]
MLTKIAHIGVAVSNLQEALAFYKAVGIEPSHIEDVPSQKVKVAFITIGDVHIELLEPSSPESPIAGFLDKRGQGMHHIAYEVRDIHTVLKTLKDKGIKLINETPVEGAHEMMVAFVHPKSASGVLTELCQHK